MELRKEIADLTTKRLTFTSIDEVKIDGKRLILFQIPSSPGTVVTFNGIPYGRDGQSLVGLSIDKIDRIRVGGYDWSKDVTAYDAESLDPKAVALFRELFVANNPRMSDISGTWTVTELLERTGLMSNGHLTNAAMILLGDGNMDPEYEPGVEISWILKQDGRVIDYEHFKRPFLTSSASVIGKISNLTFRRLMEGLVAEEMPTYDPEALREALNNAIIHTDYRIGSRIEVIENFNESVVICNPGTFLSEGAEDIYRAGSAVSVCRNQLMASTLYSLGQVDRVGMGIIRIFDAQVRRYFPLPEYTCRDNRVCLEIRGGYGSEAVARVLHFNKGLKTEDIMILDKYQKGKKLDEDEAREFEALRSRAEHGNELPEMIPARRKDLTANQERLLEILERNPRYLIKDLASESGLTEKTVSVNLRALEAGGYIVRDKTARTRTVIRRCR